MPPSSENDCSKWGEFVSGNISEYDRVPTSDPSYQGSTEVFRAAGAHLLPVPVDREGLDPAKLPARARIARRQTLLDSIRKWLGDRVEVTGDGAGAHVVLWPRHAVSEEAVITRAASYGVGVYGLSPYYLKPPARTGILLGYSRMREKEIREGIRRLSAAV